MMGSETSSSSNDEKSRDKLLNQTESNLNSIKTPFNPIKPRIQPFSCLKSVESASLPIVQSYNRVQTPESLQAGKYFLNSSEVVIQIEGFKFNPAELFVHAGTKLIWKVKTNKASYNSLYDKSGPRFFIIGIPQLEEESPPIHEEESYSLTVEQSGTFDVKCLNYLKMKGVLVVVDKLISLSDLKEQQQSKGINPNRFMEQVDDFKYSKTQSASKKQSLKVLSKQSPDSISSILPIQEKISTAENIQVPSSQSTYAFFEKPAQINISETIAASKQEIILTQLKEENIRNHTDPVEQEQLAKEFLQELEEEEQSLNNNVTQLQKKHSHYLQLYRDDFKEEIGEDEGEDSEVQSTKSQSKHKRKGNTNTNGGDSGYEEEEDEEEDDEEQHQQLSQQNQKKKRNNNNDKTSPISKVQKLGQSQYEQEKESDDEGEDDEDGTQYDCNAVISEEDGSNHTSKENSLINRMSNSSSNLRSGSGSASSRSVPGYSHPLDCKFPNKHRHHVTQLQQKSSQKSQSQTILSQNNKNIRNITTTTSSNSNTKLGLISSQRKKNTTIKSGIQDNYLKSPAQSILTTAESSKYSDTTRQFSQKGDFELEVSDMKGSLVFHQKHSQKRRASTDQIPCYNSNNGLEDSDTRSIKSLKNEPLSNAIKSEIMSLPNSSQQEQQQFPDTDATKPQDIVVQIDQKPQRIGSDGENEDIFGHQDHHAKYIKKNTELEKEQEMIGSLNKASIQYFLRQQASIEYKKMEQAASQQAAKMKEQNNQSLKETKENLEKDKNILKDIRNKSENMNVSEAETAELKYMIGKLGEKDEEVQRNLEEEIQFVNTFLQQRYEVENWILSMTEGEEADIEEY